jgi:GAF domain-containing protein
MQVMREGKAIAIPDTHKESDRLNPTMLQSNSRAAVCLPLSLPNKRLGVLWIHYDRPRRFTQFEIDALQLYVDQVAIAYENAHRIHMLERIRQASDSLARVKSIDEVLKQILQGAREALRADAAVLWAYDAEWKRFIVERSISAGVPDDIWGEYCQLGPRQDGTAFNIMHEGWELISDAEDEAQIQELGERTQKLLREFPARGFQDIALKVGEEKLGVLYALYRQSLSVNEGEKKIALTFAAHAALALQKARLLEQLQKTTQAAAAVAKVSVFGDHQETLYSIVKEVKEAVGCDAVVLFEYNRSTSRIMQPPTMIGVNHPGRVLSLDEQQDYLLVHKMLDMDEPYPVEEIANDPDFKDKRFARDEEIRSCIAVPLQASGQKVGVMFVNYRRSFRFSPYGLRTIQLLANQAAVALGYAQLLEERDRQLKELEQTRGLVIARTALAWVSMNSFAWGHSIGNHASTINDFVNLLYNDLKTHASEVKLKEKLGKIEEMTNTIQQTLLAAPLSDEEGVDSVPICDLIGERINQLRTSQRSSTLNGEQPIECQFIEHRVNNPTIRASSEWLKRAFDLLVDNAIEAMAKSEKKVLTVDIQLVGDNVEISVSDTGDGIPPEIQNKLLQQPIYKPKGAKGSGIGLLLAQVIAQAYGGDIRIGSTGAMGTTMIISLPFEGNRATGK